MKMKLFITLNDRKYYRQDLFNRYIATLLYSAGALLAISLSFYNDKFRRQNKYWW